MLLLIVLLFIWFNGKPKNLMQSQSQFIQYF